VKFAEAGDPLTFTERIPFAETRDYVKQIHRNLTVYRLLYGDR
jgi:soluble lytic murein transglycosylase-like protein